MLLIFLVFCVVLCFCVLWLPSSCVPNVASVSGLSKFLIVPSVFSNVFFVLCLACSICQCLWIVHSCLPLQFSPRFICHVVCVSNVASVSGLSILVCPFNFLQGLFVMCFVYPMLPVSLDCPFLFAPSVFSKVYLSCVLCIQCCQCLWIVHAWIPLRFSLTFAK